MPQVKKLARQEYSPAHKRKKKKKDKKYITDKGAR